jgi:hypothetical protein
MSGFMRRHEAGCFWATMYILFLAISELMIVSVLVAPYDSTRLDWQAATLVFAPLLAGGAVVTLLFVGLTAKVLVGLLRWLMRLIHWTVTKART